MPYRKGKVWFYADSNGKQVLNPVYKEALAFEKGLAAVCDSNGLWGLINRQGKFVVTPRYKYISEPENGIRYTWTGTEQSWIDSNGVPAKWAFEKLEKFINGIAIARNKNQYGLIRSNGKWVLELSDKWIHKNGDCYAVVNDEQTCIYYDLNGKRPFKALGGSVNFEGNYARGYDVNDRVVYYNRNGIELYPAPYSWVQGDPREGGVIVRNTKTGGLAVVDSTGRFVLGPELKQIFWYAPNFVFTKDSLYDIFIPRTGRIIHTQFRVPNSYYCNDHYCLYFQLHRGKRYNYMDSTGRVLFEKDYDQLGEIRDGATWTRRDSTLTWWDKSGKAILVVGHSQYNYVKLFDEQEYAIVFKEKNLQQVCGLINNKGREVLPCKFKQIVFNKVLSEYIATDEDSTWFMNIDGKIRKWPIVVRALPNGDFIINRRLQKPKVAQNIVINQSFGLADKNGKVLLEPVYGLVDQISEDHYVIGKSEAYNEYQQQTITRSYVEYFNLQLTDRQGKVLADLPEFPLLKDGFLFFRKQNTYMRLDGLAFYED